MYCSHFLKSDFLTKSFLLNLENNKAVIGSIGFLLLQISLFNPNDFLR